MNGPVTYDLSQMVARKNQRGVLQDRHRLRVMLKDPGGLMEAAEDAEDKAIHHVKKKVG